MGRRSMEAKGPLSGQVRKLVKSGHSHGGWRKKGTADGGRVQIKTWGTKQGGEGEQEEMQDGGQWGILQSA